MADRIPITREGYRALEEEIKKLRKERPKIAKSLADARSHGDFTENSEYDDAKQRQDLLETRLRDLEDKLARSIIIDPGAHKIEGVAFGVKVRIRDVSTGREVSYTIVGEGEADISAGKISITSPIARALVGHKTGERVEVNVPSGLKVFDILEVK